MTTARKVKIDWVDSEAADATTTWHELLDGLRTASSCPAASAIRGIEGNDCGRAGTPGRNGIPYFGICLGMQIAVIEFARNVLGYADAHSSEFAPDDQRIRSST